MNIQEQKEKLIQEQQAIENDLNSLGKNINNKGDWVITSENIENNSDPLDDAQNTVEMEEKIAVLNVLEQRHKQITQALDSIENGTYGICKISGEKISEERLLANPSATTCIKHTL